MTNEEREELAKTFISYSEKLAVYYNSRNPEVIMDNVDVMFIGFAEVLNESSSKKEFCRKVLLGVEDALRRNHVIK